MIQVAGSAGVLRLVTSVDQSDLGLHGTFMHEIGGKDSNIFLIIKRKSDFFFHFVAFVRIIVYFCTRFDTEYVSFNTHYRKSDT